MAPAGVGVLSTALLLAGCGRIWFEELPLDADAGLDAQPDQVANPDGGGGDAPTDAVSDGPGTDAPNETGPGDSGPKDSGTESGPVDSGTTDAGTVTASNADTYVKGLDNTPHGGDVDLVVGRANGGQLIYALVKFDLSSIPSSATVVSATLRLYQFENTSTATFSIGAHQLLETWDEATATFTNASTGTPWGTAGGTYNATAESTTTVPLGTYGWYQWDLTALVQAWVSGTKPNYGVELTMGSVSQGQSVGFASRENTTASERPQLVVTTQ